MNKCKVWNTQSSMLTCSLSQWVKFISTTLTSQQKHQITDRYVQFVRVNCHCESIPCLRRGRTEAVCGTRVMWQTQNGFQLLFGLCSLNADWVWSITTRPCKHTSNNCQTERVSFNVSINVCRCAHTTVKKEIVNSPGRRVETTFLYYNAYSSGFFPRLYEQVPASVLEFWLH